MIASVAEYHQEIQVWDIATGKLLHEFDAPGIFRAAKSRCAAQ
jgi:hypothetical protein